MPRFHGGYFHRHRAPSAFSRGMAAAEGHQPSDDDGVKAEVSPLCNEAPSGCGARNASDENANISKSAVALVTKENIMSSAAVGEGGNDGGRDKAKKEVGDLGRRLEGSLSVVATPLGRSGDSRAESTAAAAATPIKSSCRERLATPKSHRRRRRPHSGGARSTPGTSMSPVRRGEDLGFATPAVGSRDVGSHTLTEEGGGMVEGEELLRDDAGDACWSFDSVTVAVAAAMARKSKTMRRTTPRRRTRRNIDYMEDGLSSSDECQRNGKELPRGLASSVVATKKSAPVVAGVGGPRRGREGHDGIGINGGILESVVLDFMSRDAEDARPSSSVIDGDGDGKSDGDVDVCKNDKSEGAGNEGGVNGNDTPTSSAIVNSISGASASMTEGDDGDGSGADGGILESAALDLAPRDAGDGDGESDGDNDVCGKDKRKGTGNEGGDDGNDTLPSSAIVDTRSGGSTGMIDCKTAELVSPEALRQKPTLVTGGNGGETRTLSLHSPAAALSPPQKLVGESLADGDNLLPPLEVTPVGRSLSVGVDPMKGPISPEVQRCGLFGASSEEENSTTARSAAILSSPQQGVEILDGKCDGRVPLLPPPCRG